MAIPFWNPEGQMVCNCQPRVAPARLRRGADPRLWCLMPSAYVDSEARDEVNWPEVECDRILSFAKGFLEWKGGVQSHFHSAALRQNRDSPLLVSSKDRHWGCTALPVG